MNDVSLKVTINSDWVSVVCPELEVGGSGEDVVEAFTAFGRSYSSFYVSKAHAHAPIASHAELMEKADSLRVKASRLDKVEKGKLEESAREVIAESANALRVRRWREKNRDTYLERNRKAVAGYRERKRKSGEGYAK